MVSGGAGSFARRLGAAAAPNPETRYKKPAGRSAPGRPRARELERAGGARAGSPARGGGRGRCPGALAPVAHLARRRQPGGDRRPGPGGGAAGSPRRGAWLPGGGLGAGPRSHFVLCKSHESGFPRAGAAMPAAEGRARAPLCKHRAGRRRLRLLPARPGRRSAGPRALARAGPPSLPPSPAGSLARSPPPRLGALESAEFVEREPFKFSALGCLERGLLATKKDGGEREEETLAAAAGPGAPGAPHPPSRPALPGRGLGGSGERTFGARPRSWAACAAPNPVVRVCFAERAVVFVLCAGGEGDSSVGPCGFLRLRLDSVRRGLVVINTTERFPGLVRVCLGIGPRARPETPADRQVGADLLKTPGSRISTLLFFSHGLTRVREGEEPPRRSSVSARGLILTLYLKPENPARPRGGLCLCLGVSFLK